MRRERERVIKRKEEKGKHKTTENKKTMIFKIERRRATERGRTITQRE